MASTNWSYIQGLYQEPIQYETVCDYLDNMAASGINHVSAIHYHLDGSTEEITLQEVHQKSKKLAKYLVQCGFQRLDKIAIIGPNSIPWLIGDLAIVYAGCVAVQMAVTMADGSDLEEVIRAAEIKGLFVGDLGHGLTEVLSNVARSKNVQVFYMEDSKGEASFDSILNKPEPDVQLPKTYPEDGAFVFTTSGTTGKPKLVQHTHLSVFRMKALSDREMSGQSVLYNDRPFCWIAGFPIGIICTGNTLIFMKTDVAASGKNTLHIWELFKKTGCTIALLMPYFTNDMLDNVEVLKSMDFKLETMVLVGQLIENVASLIGSFCSKALIGYGQTEIGIATTISIRQGSVLPVVGDVGVPQPGIEIRIVDDAENTTTRGTLGSIHLRGVSKCICYLGDPEQTAALFAASGWLRTGDVGLITEAGQLMIKGREKDVISRGTRKIIPAHVESVIKKFKGIKDVVVVGVPHKRLGEDVCACFVPQKDADDLSNFVKEESEKVFLKDDALDGLGELPSFYLCFKEFPLSSNGKLDRKSLKEEALKRLGL